MKNSNMQTVGIDIGDVKSEICVVEEVNGEVEVIERTEIFTTEIAFRRYFSSRAPMVVALEVGTHSPWISRVIAEEGHEVLVANSRKTRFIYDSDDKTDDVDAEKLARVARADSKLLYPIKHREKEVQSMLSLVRSRDILVKTRSKLISHVRGVVKTGGARISGCSAESFHRYKDQIPKDLKQALNSVVETIETVTEKIRSLDRKIEKVSKDKFPETETLRKVPGIGPVTALAFILTIGDPYLFSNNRKVGKYLGLTPKKDESGESNPQLRITRAGNKYTRSLLICCAHYILGRYGPDSDLRSYGMRIAARGGKNAKKRAAVAVARKLSVLLLSILKSGEDYQPFHNKGKQQDKKEAA